MLQIQCQRAKESSFSKMQSYTYKLITMMYHNNWLPLLPLFKTLSAASINKGRQHCLTPQYIELQICSYKTFVFKNSLGLAPAKWACRLQFTCPLLSYRNHVLSTCHAWNQVQHYTLYTPTAMLWLPIMRRK